MEVAAPAVVRGIANPTGGGGMKTVRKRWNFLSYIELYLTPVGYISLTSFHCRPTLFVGLTRVMGCWVGSGGLGSWRVLALTPRVGFLCQAFAKPKIYWLKIKIRAIIFLIDKR